MNNGGGQASSLSYLLLLESTRTTNGLVQLILYSKTGMTNRVQSTPSLPVAGPWKEWQQPPAEPHAVTTNESRAVLPCRPAVNAAQGNDFADGQMSRQMTQKNGDVLK